MMAMLTMGVVASAVMGSLTHLSVSPYAVVRPCWSRGDRCDDCRRTQCHGQDTARERTRRPAERNQINHTHPSLHTPVPHDRQRFIRANSRHPRFRMRFGVWREQDEMRRRGNGFEVILRSFN